MVSYFAKCNNVILYTKYSQVKSLVDVAQMF